ncbi:immunoglobulin superfamily member 10-like [Betta splendens]|uniref:immunoglobulin superfamily member 10-like n=1 Tax=Betta splendens TaxID=158456 RepID=UPI00244E58EF|nr:immunoglobulin superfamily member 10-like [Betta splendens]
MWLFMVAGLLACADPPTFTHPENETVEVAAHSKLRLNCAAEGKPPPEYTWQNLQMGQNLNGNGSTLAPSFHLPGTYSCTASNVHGTRTKYFTIKETAGNHLMIRVAISVVLVLLGIGLAACIVYQRRVRYQPMPSGPV